MHPTYDLVVVGSGAAGLTAALRAHGLGLRVLVVEKSSWVGGTTAWSGGAVWVPANHALLATGAEDTSAEGLRYLEALTKGTVASVVLRHYVETGPAALQFLEARTPLRFVACHRYPDYYPELPGGRAGGRSVEPERFDGYAALGRDAWSRLRPALPMALILGRVGATIREAHTLVTGGFRGQLLAGRLAAGYFLGWPWRRRGGQDRYVTLGRALAAGLYAGVLEAGIEVWTESPLVDLITAGRRVRGCLVERPDGPIEVHAGAVLLAAGGYARAPRLKARLFGEPAAASWSAAIPEDTGDAVLVGESVGAKVDLGDAGWWMPVFCVPGEAYARALVMERSLPGSLMVLADGQRFANESAPYEDVVIAWRRRARELGTARAWLIFDARFRWLYPCGPLYPGLVEPDLVVPRRLWRGWLHRADTIPALACAIGLDPERLTTTVERFNEHAVRGEDPEFGRGESCYDRYYADPSVEPNPCLRPLSVPPFYAVPVYPGDLGTKGGLAIDVEGRVLGRDGSPITGLFAAGNSAANPLGDVYPGAGGTLGPAIVWGWTAAETAARGGT